VKEAFVHNSEKGIIFNIQRYSLNDGPGIRTTVFMKGCSLKCKWCSNPESINAYPELMFYSLKCNKSEKCLQACPMGAIEIVNNALRIDRTKCNLCMECTKSCPSEALMCSGSYVSVEKVVIEIESDRTFYRNSGGGVTISGGEPLFQGEFVYELLKECKSRGLHTALDTSGHAPWNIMERVLNYVDLVLFDIKNMDPTRHMAGTGVDNELILSNLRKTARQVTTWLRFPVIPGFNDSESNARELAQFASTISVEKVSLLPYHSWGEGKYEKLGRTYPFKDTPIPAEEHINSLKEIIESYGLMAEVGK
jgi:pyruvate formate lyase activating enzyme